jgi:hypothetical protein
MSVNTVQVSARNAPLNGGITAAGGYTLPQHAFIPHSSLQQLATGSVGNPAGGIQSASFAIPQGIAARPYPVPIQSGAFGIRAVTIKSSPAG